LIPPGTGANVFASVKLTVAVLWFAIPDGEFTESVAAAATVEISKQHNNNPRVLYRLILFINYQASS
jgi:hypothetical protein